MTCEVVNADLVDARHIGPARRVRHGAVVPLRDGWLSNLEPIGRVLLRNPGALTGMKQKQLCPRELAFERSSHPSVISQPYALGKHGIKRIDKAA